MVLVWKRCLLFALVFSMFGIAGCLGDEPTPEPATDDPTESDLKAPDPNKTLDKVPKPTKKVLAEVDRDEAVFAPTWQVGQWWTFDVLGVEHPGGSATFAVTEVAADHYKLGSDSQLELAFNNLHGGPFLPRADAGIQFDSLALYHADAYQDYLGFRRPVGDTWDFTILDNKYTLTKDAVQEIEDPKGASLGILVSGAAPSGSTIEVVYSAKAAWVSQFRILTPEGDPFLSYTLTDYGVSGGAEVQRWERTETFRLNAQSPFYMADAWFEESDGSGDVRVIIMGLRNGFANGEAHATIYSPSGEEAATGTVKVGTLWQYSFVDDTAGFWPVRVHAIGGDDVPDRAKTDVWLLQMKVL